MSQQKPMLSPMEIQELKQRTRALSEEDKLIVTANIPLSNLRKEIARRDAQVDRILANVARALIPMYERDDLTLEEKNAVVKNLRKAVGA